MATYMELFDLGSDSGIRNKVAVACMVAAKTIADEEDITPNHVNRLLWAAQVFANPLGEAKRMYPVILATNKDATVATIQSASDATIQTAVDDHVDLFATG